MSKKGLTSVSLMFAPFTDSDKHEIKMYCSQSHVAIRDILASLSCCPSYKSVVLKLFAPRDIFNFEINDRSQISFLLS